MVENNFFFNLKKIYDFLKLAKKLNLGFEWVSNNKKTQKIFSPLPCDIEGHVGRDSRYYLLDVASKKKKLFS